jgi:FPC/CPF motif-containing protein YcgG
MSVSATNLLIKKIQTQLQDKLMIGAATKPTYHRFFLAGSMTDSKLDHAILQFLEVVAEEASKTPHCHVNAVVLFLGPDIITQEVFDQLFLQRMIALQQLDEAPTALENKSYTTGLTLPICGKQFYVTGLHPAHRLKALRFPFPSLVFDTEPWIAEHTARLDTIYHQCMS